MKRRVWVLFAFLAAVSFIFVGCSSSSSSEDTGVATPTVGSSADLAASGGTAPTSQSQATTLFTAACTALNTTIVNNASSSVKSARNAIGARTTDNTGDTININFTPTGGGTVVCTGSWSSNVTYPDSSWSPSANTTYNDVVSVGFTATVNGTVTGVVVSDSSYTYTINGLIKNEIDEAANIDVTTGSTATSEDASMNMDFSLGIGIGTAFSVRRSDGVGAKFIITYGANYAKNDMSFTSDLSQSETAFGTEMTDYLESQPATLKVYDDSNTLVYETTLTGNDAYVASILSNF